MVVLKKQDVGFQNIKIKKIHFFVYLVSLQRNKMWINELRDNKNGNVCIPWDAPQILPKNCRTVMQY